MENVAIFLEILSKRSPIPEIVTSDRELVAIPDGTMCDTPRSHDRRHDLTIYPTTSGIRPRSHELRQDLRIYTTICDEIFQIQKIVARSYWCEHTFRRHVI